MTVRRIAINSGGGYVPGLNHVVAGAVRAARRQGWEIVGIRDGFDGLFAHDHYPDGGLIDLSKVDEIEGQSGSILGTAARIDPFRVRTVNELSYVEEVDRSDALLKMIAAEKIDAVISLAGGSAITGSHALSVAFKLSRKGLPIVCIPKSIENDIAATSLSFGYNSALSYAVETLERIRAAARDVRRIAVVEVPGAESGWLALQSAIAVLADAALIPEIPYDLEALSASLTAGGRPSLVVVAEGSRPRNPEVSTAEPSLRKSLSPNADPAYGTGARVIERSGQAADSVAQALQRLTGMEAFPLILGQLVRGGAPTALDRQLGLGYGAGAVRALAEGQAGVMLSFQPPDIHTVPLGEALNKVRRVPTNSAFMEIAASLGIALGGGHGR
jgi:6-phosphofructokinase 1